MSVVCEEKQRSERSQIFYFNSSQVKERSECRQRKKQRSERSHVFHFNSSEVKQRSECSQIYDFSVTYDREITFQ